MADNGIQGKVIGVAFDGTGLGTDGTLWGGEFLKASFEGITRKGHLKLIQLPGGEKAIREPWRMAAAYLYRVYGGELTDMDIPFIHRLSLEKWDVLRKMLDRSINTPFTSSMGRLFDAVSSLLGIRYEVRYEGQAAIELEAIAKGGRSTTYPLRILEKEGVSILDHDETIEGIVSDMMKGESCQAIAAKFHRSLGRSIVEMCKKIREEEGLNRVMLTGGVFQNKLLLALAWSLLKDHDFEVFTHCHIPPNDGGLSLGQAMIAGVKMRKGLEEVCV
jgi:hydrogenase maturation protein HypF